jgi:hypothetical protein
MEPVVAKRRTSHGSELGIHRWVIARSLSSLRQYYRLQMRSERRDDSHDTFLFLGCGLMCWRFVCSFCEVRLEYSLRSHPGRHLEEEGGESNQDPEPRDGQCRHSDEAHAEKVATHEPHEVRIPAPDRVVRDLT